MRREMRALRVDIIFDDANGRLMPPEQHYIELSAWTGARPDKVAATLTEDKALSLAYDILGAVLRQRSWK